MKLDEIMKSLGVSFYPEDPAVKTWSAWYAGKDPAFHDYTMFSDNTGTVENYEKRQLKAAKEVCERWADVIYNPETKITIEGDAEQIWLDKELERLAFGKNFNKLVEWYFALGRASMNYYQGSNGKPAIDFLPREFMKVVDVDNDDVTSAAFISAEDDLLYITLHLKQYDGNYLIINKVYRQKENNKAEYEDVTKYYDVDELVLSPIKMFSVFKPAISDASNLKNAQGVSVFAYAIDTLKAVDTAFDGVMSEVELGQMRLIMSEDVVTQGIDANGKSYSRFSPTDAKLFYNIKYESTDDNGTSAKDEMFEIIAPQLRTQDFVDSLQVSLNLLGRKTGLGDNYFQFKEGTLYTNTTQVLSTNSEFVKTREKHLTSVRVGLIEMVKALYFLEFGEVFDGVINVEFDDSIYRDKEKEFEQALTRYNAGMISKIQAIQESYGMTREEAIAFYKQQQEDMQLTGDVTYEEVINTETVEPIVPELKAEEQKGGADDENKEELSLDL